MCAVVPGVQTCALPSLRALIADATDEIDRQTRARILIIEDEPIIAMDIEMIVRDLGHEVVAVATTHREAVDEAQKHQPGLVLADIQLADNSSGIADRKSVVEGKSVAVRVDLGGWRFIKKKNKNRT